MERLMFQIELPEPCANSSELSKFLPEYSRKIPSTSLERSPNHNYATGRFQESSQNGVGIYIEPSWNPNQPVPEAAPKPYI